MKSKFDDRSSWFHHTSGENTYMKKIREAELAKPASFSSEKVRLLPECVREKPDTNRIANIKVSEIAGLDFALRLRISDCEISFSELLFYYLHGASLVKESFKYFESSSVKAESRFLTSEFLHFPNKEGLERKATAQRGMSFLFYDGSYYADQGRHRAMIAKYYLYHFMSPEAELQNVDISDSMSF